jgi:hypothetical protein
METNSTEKILGEVYRGHLFFDLDNTDAWINSIAFQAYMNTINGNYDEYRTQNSTPFSSRAPSRAGSSLGSRASSRANSVFSLAGSRPSSRASFIPPSRAASSRASSPCDKEISSQKQTLTCDQSWPVVSMIPLED